MNRVLATTHKRRAAIIIGAMVFIVAVVLLVVFLFMRQADADTNIASATVTTGDVATTVSGSGTATASVDEVPMAYDIILDSVNVAVGDYVTKGDVLATISADSLNGAIDEVQTGISDLNTAIADAGTTNTVIAYAPMAGTITAVNCVAGDDAADKIAQYESLVTLQLDGGETMNLGDGSGTVGEVFVSAGATVAAGDALYSLVVPASDSALSTLQVQKANLLVKLSVLENLAVNYRLVASTTGTVSAVNVAAEGTLSATTTGDNSTNSDSSSGSDSATTGSQGMASASISANTGGSALATGDYGNNSNTGTDTSLPNSQDTAQTYALIYYLDGGSMPAGVSNITSYSSSYPAFTLNNPIKDGYTFAGWTARGGIDTRSDPRDPQSADKAQNPMQVPQGSKGDISFTATWKAVGAEDGSTTQDPNALPDDGTTPQNPGGEPSEAPENTSNPQNPDSNGNMTPAFYSTALVSTTAVTAEATDTTGTTAADTVTPQATATAGSYRGAAFTITSTTSMAVDITVDELDVSSLAIGQQAAISFDALSDTYSGTVRKIAASSSSSTGSGYAGVGGTGSSMGSTGSSAYTATIVFDKTSDIYEGMSASARITKQQVTGVLVLPAAALQEYGSNVFVYTTQNADGSLGGDTQITVGLSDGTTVEISAGLSEGQTVYYTVNSGSTTASNSSSSQSMQFGGQGPSIGGMPGFNGNMGSAGGFPGAAG